MKTLPMMFWQIPHLANETVTRKELREILLAKDFICARGVLWDVKSKHLGAGIYKIYLKERK